MSMQTSLQGIARKARTNKDHRFGNLYEMLNEENLLDSWQYIRKNAACGVDKVSAREYEKNLKENISGLVERLKSKSYKAKLIRRQYIPKDNGKLRPLGIPATEDKLLQVAVTRILQAIYEEEFMRCSYGYRPNVGAKDAVDKLTVKLQFGNYNYILDADLRGYFDTIDHDKLMEMLEARIEDKQFVRLIRKWLKAGVLETDGRVINPATGVPQGGIISPILSNVYLHNVLDTWFHREALKDCRGEACLIRYADDYICAFEYKEEAERFYERLQDRLKGYGLELSEEKTKIISFNRDKDKGTSRFDFLGFEFYWGTDRKGKAHLKRRTSRKKLRKSIANFTEWCRSNRHMKLREFFRKLNQKLKGYYNYYCIPGNSSGISEFSYQAMHILHKWLNRRSQRGSYNWSGFRELLKHFKVPVPRKSGWTKPKQMELYV